MFSIKLKKIFQKYLHADFNYVVSGSFWLTTTQVFTYFGSIVSAYIFANFVDQTTYGNYSFVLSVFAFTSMFSLPGMDTAITQAVAKGQQESFYSGKKTKLHWSFIGSFVLSIIATYFIFYKHQNNVGFAILLGAIITPFLYSHQIFTAFLSGLKKFKTQTKYRVSVQLISYSTTATAIFINQNLIFLVFVYLLSNTLSNLYFYNLAKKKFKPNKKSDPKTLSYGKHLSFLQSLNIITSYLDSILIFHFLGPVQLAIYSFALRPIQQILTAFSNFGHLFLPKFSEKTISQLQKTFYLRIIQLLVIGVLLSLTYIATAPFLFKILFPKYAESVKYTQLFGLTLIIQVLGPYISSVFRSQKMTKTLYISGISTHTLMLLLMLILGYFYGIIGIILAKLITPLYSLVISIILWQREIKINAAENK